MLQSLGKVLLFWNFYIRNCVIIIFALFIKYLDCQGNSLVNKINEYQTNIIEILEKIWNKTFYLKVRKEILYIKREKKITIENFKDMAK